MLNSPLMCSRRSGFWARSGSVASSSRASAAASAALAAAGRWTFNYRKMLLTAAFFGGFQFLMPLIGFFLGSLFASAIEAFDHWVAFGLLGIIGVNMLKEAFSKEEEESCGCDLSFRTMLVMAIATSIDALAVGISLAMAGDVNIWVAILLIGFTTFSFSAGERLSSSSMPARGASLMTES